MLPPRRLATLASSPRTAHAGRATLASVTRRSRSTWVGSHVNGAGTRGNLHLKASILPLTPSSMCTGTGSGILAPRNAARTFSSLPLSNSRPEVKKFEHRSSALTVGHLYSHVLSHSSIAPGSLDSSRYLTRRGLAIPLLGGLGASAIGLFALKKVTIIAIIHKYGLEKTCDFLRVTNNEVYARGAYPKIAHTAIAVGIDTLQTSAASMDMSHQADAVWQYVKSLSSKELNAGIIRKFIADFNPLGEKSKEAKADAEKQPSDEATTKTEAESFDAEVTRLSKLIVERVPELNDKWIVVLVDKKIKE